MVKNKKSASLSKIITRVKCSHAPLTGKDDAKIANHSLPNLFSPQNPDPPSASGCSHRWAERLLWPKAAVATGHKRQLSAGKSYGPTVSGHLLPYNHRPSTDILRNPRMTGISRLGTAF
jgi:hypothetical protein